MRRLLHQQWVQQQDDKELQQVGGVSAHGDGANSSIVMGEEAQPHNAS